MLINKIMLFHLEMVSRSSRTYIIFIDKEKAYNLGNYI